jgi:hypothetical protein
MAVMSEWADGRRRLRGLTERAAAAAAARGLFAPSLEAAAAVGCAAVSALAKVHSKKISFTKAPSLPRYVNLLEIKRNNAQTLN